MTGAPLGHTRADDDPRTQLGHQIGRRWHRAGPGRHAGLGVLASYSRRFVAGMGRGVLIRRAYAGPATAPVAGTRGLSVGPPRWWREAHLLAGAEPPDTSPGMPADTSSGRGLARALRPMPSAAPGRPQGTLMTSAPKTVPMRLPTEVTAVGRLTTPADTAARRIRPGREPGPSQGADRSSAPAPAGGRAPESPPRPAAPSAPAIRRQAVATQTAGEPRSAAALMPSAAVGHGRPVPTEGLSRLAPRLARRRAAAAVAAAMPAPRTRIRRTTGGLPTATRASTSARLGSAVPPSRPSQAGRTQVARLRSTSSPTGQSPAAQPQSTASRAGQAPAGATPPPTVSSPAGQTSAERAQAGPTSAAQTPAGRLQTTRAQSAPSLDARTPSTQPLTTSSPAGQAPADQAPAERAQTGPASAAQSQSMPSPTGRAPDGPAPAGQTPSEATGLAAAESGAASAPLRTALRRMPSSTARLVRADPLDTGAADAGLTPGRHRADTAVPTTPRLGTHRVRPGGGWAVAARRPAGDGLAAIAAAPGSPGSPARPAQSDRTSVGATSSTHHEPAGLRPAPASRPTPSDQSASPARSGIRPPQASPALARRWETTRAAHLPGATGRHWRAEPASASRPGLGIESPDLLAAAPLAGDPVRRVAALDLSRARPRPGVAGRSQIDRLTGPAGASAPGAGHIDATGEPTVSVRRAGPGHTTGLGIGPGGGRPAGGRAATHSAHGFPWLVAAAHAEIAPPSPGLPRVPAMSPVGAHPSAPFSAPFRAGPLGTAARPAPPVPRSARRSPDTSTGDVPGRFAGTSADVLAAPHLHRLTASAGSALSALAGASVRVAPPRTVIQRVPATAIPATPASAIPRPPAPSTGPSGGAAPGDDRPHDRPGVSFPIVRRWMAAEPSTPGAAMRGDDRSLIGSQRTEETGLTDSVMARVDERIQARLAAELDSELSDRVHRIIDERLGAELERQAWRREAGGF